MKSYSNQEAAELKQQRDHLLHVLSTKASESPLELVKFCTNSDPNVRRMIESNHFSFFWSEQLNSLRLSDDSSFRFREPTSQSKMAFYCGYILYLEALSCEAKRQYWLSEQYTKQAYEQFSSFHALYNMTMSLTVACSANSKPISTLLNHLQNNDSQIKRFKTPGFLLLADAYHSLTMININNQEKREEYYQKCWLNLHWAQLLEKESAQEIHNAYFTSEQKYTTTFKGNSILEFKHNFQLSLQLVINVSSDQLRLIERSVTQDYYLSTMPTIDTSLVTNQTTSNTSPMRQPSSSPLFFIGVSGDSSPGDSEINKANDKQSSPTKK